MCELINIRRKNSEIVFTGNGGVRKQVHFPDYKYAVKVK